jgi:hypothetical protein
LKQLALVVLLCFYCSPSLGDQIPQIYGDGKALYADLQLCVSLGVDVPESQFPPAGNEDYGKCKLAHGYIAGITDYLATFNKHKVCLPLSVNEFQVYDAVFEWLESHPVMMRYSAPLLIKRAIQDTWPCTGK